MKQGLFSVVVIIGACFFFHTSNSVVAQRWFAQWTDPGVHVANIPDEKVMKEFRQSVQEFESNRKKFEETNAQLDASRNELSLPTPVPFENLGQYEDTPTAEQMRVTNEKETLLRKLIEKEPANPTRRIALARHYAATSQYGDAKGEAEEAQKLAIANGDDKSAATADSILKILAEADRASVGIFKKGDCRPDL